MNRLIHDLNMDLDLISDEDLAELARVFDAAGAHSLHVETGDRQRWSARFETDESFDHPEQNFSKFLSIIESLPESLSATFHRCTLREFALGYERGPKPWAFHDKLSADLLARIASAGASLSITIYPDTYPGQIFANSRGST